MKGTECAGADYSYHDPVVVFDLDDTLFLERIFCRSGFRVIERELKMIFGSRMAGVAMRMDSALRRREGHFDMLERILASLPDEELAPEERSGLMNGLVETYRTHIPEGLALPADRMDVLRELQRRNVAMGIITDGRSATQRRKIEALGLRNFVAPNNILISEETGFDKSSPENFRHFVRAYPEALRFIYVGDNEKKDFLIPNLMGWTTLKCAYGIDHVHPAWSSSDKMQAATYKLPRFSTLLEYL